jgi:branched-chain amino acid transport system substrate-binding protein
MKALATKRLAAAAAMAGGMAFGFGSPVLAAGAVNVGMSTALSGPIASLGIAAKRGASMAIDKLNADGGLQGKKIKLLTADGELKPATGVGNVRNFILQDKVKAIIGPVSSAVGAAEGQTAGQYHVPIIFATSNDIDQTGKYYSKYGFQILTNTYMEPHAIAAYVAKQAKKRHWKTLYTIAPNYSFGHDTVSTFMAALKKYGADLKVVGKQWPKLGASDYSKYISAIQSKHPDFLFVAQYGGDLITFTKQAQSYGLFNKSEGSGFYLLSVLKPLGGKAPSEAIAWDRAPPFYLHPTKGMKQFTKAFHDKYGDWPSTWAILGYVGVQTWAQGVKKDGSFDADKVSEALSGASIKSIRGDFKIRACDHQAKVSEYLGLLSNKVDSKYGIKTMTHVYKAPPGKIMMSCDKKKAMRKGS